MRRGLTALVVGVTAGFGVVAPALAGGGLLASSGDATSVTDRSADLNGVVFSPRPGAHWRFILSERRSFHHAEVTPAVALHGRLVAVERQLSGLSPATTYFWRVQLVSPALSAPRRSRGPGRERGHGAHAVTTLGAVKSFTTLPAADSGTGTTTTPSSTPTPPTGMSTTTTSTTPTAPTDTSTVPS